MGKGALLAGLVAAAIAVMGYAWVSYFGEMRSGDTLVVDSQARERGYIEFRAHNVSMGAISDQSITVACRTQPCFLPIDESVYGGNWEGAWVARLIGRGIVDDPDDTNENQIVLRATVPQGEHIVFAVRSFSDTGRPYLLAKADLVGKNTQLLAKRSISGFVLLNYTLVTFVAAGIALVLIFIIYLSGQSDGAANGPLPRPAAPEPEIDDAASDKPFVDSSSSEGNGSGPTHSSAESSADSERGAQ